MSGLWLASYAALWALTLANSVLLVGLLRQVGLLNKSIPNQPAPDIGEIGPPIGSRLPEISQPSMAGHGRVNIGEPGATQTLLAILTPTCRGCHRAAESLNTLLKTRNSTMRTFIVMRGEEESCRLFTSLFEPQCPVAWDAGERLITALQVNATPFGLLYDEAGVLVRKGVIEEFDHLLALLADPAASRKARSMVHPQSTAPPVRPRSSPVRN